MNVLSVGVGDKTSSRCTSLDRYSYKRVAFLKVVYSLMVRPFLRPYISHFLEERLFGVKISISHPSLEGSFLT